MGASAVKGNIFPSFLWKNQGDGRAHTGKGCNGQKGHQWKRHAGNNQRLRLLRRVCAPILSSKDEATMAAVEQIRISTSTEPTPEYGMLYLINRVMDMCNPSPGVIIPFAEMAPLVMSTLLQAVEQEPTDGGSECDREDSPGGTQQRNRENGDDVSEREARDQSQSEALQGSSSEADGVGHHDGTTQLQGTSADQDAEACR